MPSSRRASTACIRPCCGSSRPPRAAPATRGKPVAVCGGLASDPEAVPLLLGLGVVELSVVPAQIPRLKALIRTLTLDALPRTGASCARPGHRRRGARAGQRLCYRGRDT